LMVTALVNRLLAGSPTWMYISGMFLSNVLIGWITIEILRAYGRRQKAKEPVHPAAQSVAAPSAGHH